MGHSSDSKVYRLLRAPNPYAEHDKDNSAVSIKIFDVLYNDEMCSLVLMQDLSPIIQDSKKHKAHRAIISASAYIQEDL